jgi:predicted small secreted protein
LPQKLLLAHKPKTITLIAIKKLTQTLLASILFVSLCMLSGCNTIKGIGEDFESIGESIQNAGN